MSSENQWLEDDNSVKMAPEISGGMLIFLGVIAQVQLYIVFG